MWPIGELIIATFFIALLVAGNVLIFYWVWESFKQLTARLRNRK